VDISGLKGRQLTASDFYEFTHIFALDQANLEGIRARASRDASAHVAMLLDVLPNRRGEPVPNPYHGDDAGFIACWETVLKATDELVVRFAKDGVAARF